MPSPSKTSSQRVGSHMSTRQMARAAVAGHRISFQMTDCPDVQGYLVGMDDFHWLIVEAQSECVALIHKGLIPVTRISPEPTLHAEYPRFQERVQQVGGGFFHLCAEQYLGKQPSATSGDPS